MYQVIKCHFRPSPDAFPARVGNASDGRWTVEREGYIVYFIRKFHSIDYNRFLIACH